MADWSGLDASFFIRTGSALVYVLLGAFMATVKPRRSANLAVAAMFLMFGASLVASNLQMDVFGRSDHLTFGNTIAGTVLFYGSAAATVWALMEYPIRLRRQQWKPWLVPAILVTGALVAEMVYYVVQFDAIGDRLESRGISVRISEAGGLLERFAILLAWGTLLLFVAAAGERLRSATRKDGFGLAAVTFALTASSLSLAGEDLMGDLLTWEQRLPLEFPSLSLAALFCVLWLLRGAWGPVRRAAVLLTLTLLGAILLGILTPGDATPEIVSRGRAGFLRLLGAGVLAFAIFRRDLLGVPLPSARAQAGALASLFLIVLFALSQILQNFLNDSLGLIFGGVVAGIVVFAAGPMERRFSSLAHHGRMQHEDVYREAVRLALRDGKIKPHEERHLVVMAEKLGVGAQRAYAIKDEEQAARHRLSASDAAIAGQAG